MATVDTLLVRIEADMSDLRRGLRKVEGDVQRTTNKASASFKKLGGVFKLLAVGVVVRQAFIAGKAMVNLASDIEEMQGKSKVVFGEFRKGVVLELSAFGDSVGRSSHELEGMASTIQDTFVPMGFARGEAAKLSVEMTKLAVDVASFNNASDTDTMNAFQSALVGNHETVRRFGVIITETTLDQELMTMGIKGGTKAATEAQKVQARLNLITSGVKDAQGDAARTAESYANQMRGLRGEFSELVGALGEKFLPMLVSVIKTLRTVTERVKAFLQSMNIIDTPLSDALKNTQTQIDNTTDKLQKLQLEMSESTLMAQGVNNINDVKEMTAEIEALRLQYTRLKQESLPSKGTGAKREFKPEDINSLIGTAGAKGSDTGSSLFGDADKFLQETENIEAQQKAIKKLAGLHLDLHEAQSRDQPNLTDEIKRQIHFEEMRGQFTEVSEDKIRELSDAQWYAKHATDAFTKSLAEKQKLEDEELKNAELGLALFENKTQATLLLEEQTEQLSAALREGSITWEEYLATLERLKEIPPVLSPLMETLQSSVENMAVGFSNSMADMLLAGKTNSDALKQVFSSFVKTMLSKAIELLFINAIMNSIFGNVSGYVPLPQIKLNGKASGGTVQSNQPYLVGERGAELFVPSSAGTIMNNSNTKSMGGGKGTVINQVINVSAGVSQTVRDEMNSLLPRIKQETMMSIADAKRRGGAYGAAMG